VAQRGPACSKPLSLERFPIIAGPDVEPPMPAEPSVSRAATPARDVYTPSRLTLEVRALLEAGFPLLWLEGEIGNFTAAASGHLYFTLKDARAQVRCVMFRSRASLLRERPRTGDQVLLRARVSF
jgi:exodeoxyribonuclease VII large subunit